MDFLLCSDLGTWGGQSPGHHRDRKGGRPHVRSRSVKHRRQARPGEECERVEFNAHTNGGASTCQVFPRAGESTYLASRATATPAAVPDCASSYPAVPAISARMP